MHGAGFPALVRGSHECRVRCSLERGNGRRRGRKGRKKAKTPGRHDSMKQMSMRWTVLVLGKREKDNEKKKEENKEKKRNDGEV